MKSFVVLNSKNAGEIDEFLNLFYNTKLDLETSISWIKDFQNPVEICDLIGAYIDNNDKYEIKMWICLDLNILINISEVNADSVIKYLFERFPY